MVQPKLTHHENIENQHGGSGKNARRLQLLLIRRYGLEPSLWQILPRSIATKQTHVLREDKIFNYGDIIALVAADTKQHARTPPQSNRNMKSCLRCRIISMRCCRMPQGFTTTTRIYGSGSRPSRSGIHTAELFKTAPYVVEGSFYSREPHMPIEETRFRLILMRKIR